MWFKLVTVLILLVIASSGNARPRDPDPLDSSNSQEIAAETVEAVNRSIIVDSRYMMTKKQVSSPSLTSNSRRNISITSVKYDNSSKSNGMGLSMFSGLSIKPETKNYLPFGILSFGNSRFSNNLKSINEQSRQSINTNLNNHNSLTIPIVSSPQASIILPMSISISQNNKVMITNLTSSNKQKLFFPQIPLYKTNPLSPKIIDMANSNSVLRNKRMMSRNFVRIIPQKLKPGLNIHRNSTIYNNQAHITNMQLKNWPNEALQNIQDLLNYEKYTSFTNEKFKAPIRKFNVSSKQDVSIKSPEIQSPLYWSKVPVIDALSSSNDRIDINSIIHIDNLLDDLRKNNINKQQYEDVSKLTQNTLFHILNTESQRPNVTFTKPVHANNKNRTRIENNRPPQNVHIMFMMDKDELLLKNQTTGQYMPVKQILGNNTDCPTIIINSITHINNTIESKEGCTDLNIIINSQVLNTNIFKPVIDSPITLLNSSYNSTKIPYSDTSGTSSNYNQNNVPSNNYYNSYNSDFKEFINKLQTDKLGTLEPEADIPIFEVFQGTHVNVGGNDQAIEGVSYPIEDESYFDASRPNDFTNININNSSLSDPEDGNNVIIDTYAEEDNPVSQVSEFADTVLALDNVGTGQANDALGTISLPSLPNLPTGPGQLINAVSNLGNENSGTLGSTEQTNLSSTSTSDDDEDDDKLLEALSPISLLESISAVFTYYSVLNPVNYGIFSIAVAPFIAFAAGILGVAAFLFPWAFPGNLEFSRGWNDNGSKIKIRLNTNLQDIVQSSIYKYKHLNEWKGKRRKKRRKK